MSLPIFSSRPNSAKASRASGDEPTLAAPSIILIETANTLYKKARKGAISHAACREAVHVSTRLIDIVEDRSLMASAVALALEHSHPVCDCLYLALALDRRDALATADRRLAALATALGVSVELIRPAA